MAFISSAFTAGQTLTAASMEDLRGNANAGHSVFTNEAARDAAITAPTEGLMAYLTAPTVPAAVAGASGTTFLPTGVQTIYNGSAWVCLTPVGATTNTTGNTTSTSYVTTLTSDATAVSVTLVTGATALINMSIEAYIAGAAKGSFTISVSGATTYAASDNDRLSWDAALNTAIGLHRTFVLGGLTAGTNTFTLNYKTSASTINLVKRALTVQGVA